jgi:hypothetical protein
MTLQITLSDAMAVQIQQAVAQSGKSVDAFVEEVLEERLAEYAFDEVYWREEIARRIARIESGEDVLIPAEKVFADIDDMLAKYDA